MILFTGTYDSANRIDGFYEWRKQQFAPVGVPVIAYQRFLWSELEDAAGIHLGPFKDFLNYAGLRNQRVWFRIQAFSSDVQKLGVPAGIPGKQAATTQLMQYVPDWNSDVFKQRLEALFKELSVFDGHPSLAGIDIGVLGNWGEWHQYRIDAPLWSEETARFVIDLHIKSFPRTQLVAMTDNEYGLKYAVSRETNIPIGVRRDSWGNPQFDKESVWNIVADRWKIAPVVVEPRLPFDAALALEQVKKHHVSLVANGNLSTSWANYLDKEAYLKIGDAAGSRIWLKGIEVETPYQDEYFHPGKPVKLQSIWNNAGTAPRYDALKVYWTFETAGYFYSYQSTVDTRNILPGQDMVHTDAFVMPVDASAGDYKFSVKVNPIRQWPIYGLNNKAPLERFVKVSNGILSLQEDIQRLNERLNAMPIEDLSRKVAAVIQDNGVLTERYEESLREVHQSIADIVFELGRLKEHLRNI